MLMTAIECYHAGIPFAAVHDSFWTLPCYVDEMNEIIREQFILMYSFDVRNHNFGFDLKLPSLNKNDTSLSLIFITNPDRKVLQAHHYSSQTDLNVKLRSFNLKN